MCSVSLEIRLQEGFGPLPFGARTEEALRCFGPAEETENMDAGEEHRSLVWHYWTRGFSLFFDPNNEDRFSCVEIDDENVKLWGNAIFTMSEQQLKALFFSKGFKELDEEMHEWGEKRLSFDDALIDLYFENGKLISINYGVYLDDKKFVIMPN